MPAPLLCCIFFLALNRFVSASRCPRCRAVAVKPSSLSPCRGWIRGKSLARSYDARGVLRVNTVWESISCLEGTSEKLPAKLRRMLALRARAPRWALTWGGCQRWGC